MRLSLIAPWFVELVLLTQITPTDATCYTPNGEDRNKLWGNTDRYAPCSSSGISMCCSINGGGDSCRDDGLCYNAGGDIYWRESCTDPTWTDPACVKLYVNGTGINGSDAEYDSKGELITDVPLSLCDDGSWCFGGSNRGCCSSKEGYFVVDGKQTKQNPSATASATSASSSPSSSSLISSSTNSNSASPTSSSAISTGTTSAGAASSVTSTTLSTGAKAGIGIGATLGALLLIAAIFFFLRRRSQKKKAQPTEPSAYDASREEKISPPVDDARTSYYPTTKEKSFSELTDNSRRDTTISHGPSELYSDVSSPRQPSNAQLRPGTQEVLEMGSGRISPPPKRTMGELQA